MRRGDVVVGTGPGFGKKPRPAVVVQADSYLGLSTIVVALISADERAGGIDVNIMLQPDETNGLKRISYVAIHTLISTHATKIDQRIGRLSEVDTRRLNHSLLLFLGLDRV